MKRPTKQEMVLEIYDREAMGEVTAREIAIINHALVEEYGEGGAMQPAEIARILNEEELPVRFDQIFRMDSPTETYEALFRDLTSCNSLEEGEAILWRLDALYREFQRAGDKTGMRFARTTALQLKGRAAALFASPTSPNQLRAELGEIAQWVTIWLQTPDIFAQWLNLRKATAAYKSIIEMKTSGRLGKNHPGKTG
ncbi:MAG: hypothetical protein JST85_09530 [Acidobacteria bacterium]|nr:hypothetical protein [Acidobacteriota bacterium]